ncbi:MAG: ABC-type antimicrobial peptide transport system, ATPase component [Candidatus Berkelbacteria bacterium Athens1014_28]|uniref:ABC-type antimicrobial peptide transport system, ATPase component n=1 Tax=Candidatus Berkelbacteria bacterium Athens1014_28 TaxID=2017145 RepID=A0A554LLS2_9BACT|nr:MAG: ABC-type antimicrobial peptide transport system, ATPase component [Candidatus Berkelbacteria bacterium Athens1014_28]
MKNLLEIENLTKIFNPGKHAEVKAVSEIDLAVKTSEVVLIMGPSGSGKTTLLTMIGGLLNPTSGSVTLDGKIISKFNQNDLTEFRRENIGFIFQSFNLLRNLSAVENVMVAYFGKNNSREGAKKLLNRLELGQRLNFKPNDLSGGERQRVAIARALINNPKIILADEPTANLDKNIGHEVMQLLCSIACGEGKSVVIVSHDERIRDVAHRIIQIEDGKIVKEEKGGHDMACKMK